MKISRIEIDAFGKFNKFAIDLSDGFQIIHGGNEDGKTTLMDFIKLVLYSKAENARSLQNPRRKYIPFSGKPPAGALYVERGGAPYVIQKFIGETPGKDRARIINMRTGMEEPAKDREAGVWYTGLDAEGFEQICFVENIGRMEAPSGSNAEEQTIANLTGSGDKRVSRQVILKRLTDAKDALVSKSGKNGSLVEMRAKLQRLNDEKAQSEYAYQKEASLFEEYKSLLSRYDEQRRLKALAETAALRDTAAKLDRLLALIKENSKDQAALSRPNIPADRMREYVDRLRQAADEYFGAGRVLREWGASVSDSDASLEVQDEDMSQFEAAEQRAAALEAEMNALPGQQASGIGLPPLLQIPIMVLIAAFAAGLAIHFNNPWYLTLLALILLTFVNIKTGGRKTDPKLGVYEKQLEAVKALSLGILEKYGCEDKVKLRERYIAWKSAAKNVETRKRLEANLGACESNFLALAELYEPVKTPKNAQALLERLSSVLAGIEKRGSSINELARDLGAPADKPAEISERLAAMKVKIASAPPGVNYDEALREWDKIKDEDIGARLLEIQKKLKTPDYTPDQLDEDIKAFSAAAADMALYYKALDSAASVMGEAADELRSGFGAELNRRAGLILSELTNGLYTDILIGKDYSISIKNGGQYREYEYFSSGAIDQAYLALRLALSDMASGQGDPLPLLLDDALMQYDDDRLRLALKYLGGRAGQTILFTCHQHIAETARAMGARIASIQASRPGL